MIGFAHFSPHAVRVVLDRTKFLPFVCHKKEDLNNFPDIDEQNRSKVLLVHSVATLKDIPSADFDSVVVFDNADALEAVGGITIIDTRRSDEGTWKIQRITPQDVNSAVGSKMSTPPSKEQVKAADKVFEVLDDVELPEEEREVTKKRRGRPAKNESSGSLGDRIANLSNTVIEEMGIADGDAFKERIAEFRAGEVKSRSFTAQIKRLGADNKAEPYLTLKRLLDRDIKENG